jgi:O-antigen ligase
MVCFASPYSPLDRLLKPDASDIESSNIRLQLWTASGKMFVDHPLFGVGLWNFPLYMHQYLPPGVELDFVVPHNTYLEALVEMGATGLLVFLSVLGFSLWNLERMRRSAIALKDAYLAALTGSLSSGIVGFAIAVMFLSAKHAKVFWFAVFLSACLQPLLEAAIRSAKAKAVAGKTGAKPVKQELAVVQPAPIRVGNWLTRN